MHSLPISGTRDFETKPEDKPTQKGLERYYKKVLHPKLTKTEFNRIVLVDHSGGGGSVDGFRKAFHDMVQAGNPKALDDLMKVPMVLINVIDELRKDGGPRPVIKPKDVQTIAKFFPPGKDHLNKILDGKAHPRVTPEYPPPQWETPIKDSWKPGQQAAAARIEKQVKEFCAKNGGLVKDKEPPKPKKQSAPWWLKFMKYTLTR